MKFKELYESAKFTMIKLPFIYLLIVIGYILELLVEFPFMLMYKIDTIFGKRTE
jgi:hypothetical protein